MAKRKAKYPVAGVTDLREILEEQNFLCALTGDNLTPDNTTFDHIKPLSKGGSSLKENLQAVTKQSNLCKSNQEMQDFLDLCYKILKFKGKEYGYSVRKIGKTKK